MRRTVHRPPCASLLLRRALVALIIHARHSAVSALHACAWQCYLHPCVIPMVSPPAAAQLAPHRVLVLDTGLSIPKHRTCKREPTPAAVHACVP